MKFLSSLAAHMRARREWQYGLPHYPAVEVTDPVVVKAVEDGQVSIEEHRKRLGQPAEAKTGKHAKAEEGR